MIRQLFANNLPTINCLLFICQARLTCHLAPQVGTTLEQPWNNPGTTLEQPWNNPEPWNNPGTTLEQPWNNPGTTLEQPDLLAKNPLANIFLTQ